MTIAALCLPFMTINIIGQATEILNVWELVQIMWED
jgi:hypothetical protein